MAATHRRVNLTLTEMEERFLNAIMTPGSAEHDAVIRYLEWRAMQVGPAPEPRMGVADVVHVLLNMGMDRLDDTLAEISYAAEAAAHDPERAAATQFLQSNLARSVAEGNR